MITNGLWCDVVPMAGTFLLLSETGAGVRATWEDGRVAWFCPTIEPLWYLHAASLPDGSVCAIGNGQRTGTLQIVLARLGGEPVAYQVPNLISWGQCIEGAGDHWRGAIQLSPSTWQRFTIALDGVVTRGPSEPIPVWPGGDGSTSQGFLQMIDGEPIWTDPNRWLTIDGITLTLPVRCGDTACGQVEGGAGWVKPGGYSSRVIAGETPGPRMAQSGDRYAVCAWTYPGTNTLAIVAPPYPVTPEVPIVVPPCPAHLTGCGYFFRDSQQYGDNPAAPGTHSVIVDEPRSLPAEDGPDGPVRMILGTTCLLHELLPRWWDRVDAVYVAAENDLASLENQAELARYIMQWRGLTPKPILSYTGAKVFPNALTPTDIIGVQLYLESGQGPAELRALSASIYPTIAHRRVAIIGQAFDRLGTFTGEQLAEIQPTLYEIASNWPNCETLLWFSDGRKGGTRDHEAEVRPWHQAIATAVRA